MDAEFFTMHNKRKGMNLKMKKNGILQGAFSRLVLAALLLISLSGCGRMSPSPQPTPEITVPATETPSSTPSHTPTPTPAPSQPPDKATSLLWEVTDGQNRIYLLGSIHAAMESLYPLNDTIMDAFAESDALAVECDTTTLPQRPDVAEVMEPLFYTDGTTVSDHLPKELYDKTVETLTAYGADPTLYETTKPVMIASVIQTFQLMEWGYSPDLGIDMYFIEKAGERALPILELESVEFQFSLLGSFSDAIQALQIKSVVEDPELARLYLDDLYTAWQKSDTDTLEYILDHEFTGLSEEEEAAYAEYEKLMYTDRNNTMTQKAEEYLKSGDTVFVVAGAAHMLGDTGIIKQLSDKGYMVVQK